MTLSPPNSRWSSLVFPFAFVSCIFVLHLDLFISSCSAFSASNSLQIFQLIPCKSLWDLKVPSELRWQVFYCDELGHTGLFSSAQPNSLGATEAHNSVLPISLQERQLATYSYSPFAPAPLNDSCPLPASHSTCFVTQGPNPSAITQKSRRSLLGNWCQRGREKSHQSSMLNHFYRGRKREYSREESFSTRRGNIT